MKRIASILTAVSCCALSVFALTGCDALGVTITEHGIQANSNVLLIGLIVIIIVIVAIQRLTQK